MRRLPRPSHATVVAYLALFVALGGTSFAAIKVGTREIKNNSVRSVDVRNGSLRSRDIRDGSLRRRDVDFLDFAPKEVQEQGPATAGGLASLAVECPADHVALGGGGRVFDVQIGQGAVRVVNSGPLEGRSGWEYTVEINGTDSGVMRVFATCLPAL